MTTRASLRPFAVQEIRYLVREVRRTRPLRPAAVLLPMALEKINYQYDRFIDDPLCSHEINLRRNEYGSANACADSQLCPATDRQRRHRPLPIRMNNSGGATLMMRRSSRFI